MIIGYLDPWGKILFMFPVLGLTLRVQCAQIVYTLAPKYLHRDFFKANAYTI